MKLTKLLLTTTIALSFSANAALNGPDNLPWKAWADISNATVDSGILVTASTQFECITQFDDALASHAYYHGDVFTNIHHCYYNPTSGIAGGYAELQLSKDIATLEEEHNITEFLQKKAVLLKTYQDQLELLPEVPRDQPREESAR